MGTNRTMDRELEMIQLSELLTALANVGAPNATIDMDEDGQVIIHTNLRYLEDSFCEEMGAW